jgi:hypothetical protein
MGDTVVILLGCSNPLVLRPTDDFSYEVIDECFVHGLDDAVGILGPLPQPQKVTRNVGADVRRILYFSNLETRETNVEDPRLEPFPD